MLFLALYSSAKIPNIVLSVSKKESCGFDEVPYCSLLKYAIDFLVDLFINLSLTEGTFPRILENTIKQPIYKKGDRHEFSNYRGIVLLSLFSKTFERAFYLRLVAFLEKNEIFSPRQFGFLKGRSISLSYY